MSWKNVSYRNLAIQRFGFANGCPDFVQEIHYVSEPLPARIYFGRPLRQSLITFVYLSVAALQTLERERPGRGMVEKSDFSQREASLRRSGVNAADEVLHAWFVGEVLSLEAVLMQFLRNNWRNASEVEDLCQDVYLRAYEAAAVHGMPERTKPFVFTIARNLLIDRVRRGQIVPIEAMAELDRLEAAGEAPSAEQSVIAGEELRRLHAALDQLPPRCREVVVLTRVEGLTRQQIAMQMRISDRTVAKHLEIGMRSLANALYRTPAKNQ